MRTSNRMPPSSPVLAVFAEGGAAADVRMEPTSLCEWIATLSTVTFPETRLLDSVPASTSRAFASVVTVSG